MNQVQEARSSFLKLLQDLDVNLALSVKQEADDRYAELVASQSAAKKQDKAARDAEEAKLLALVPPELKDREAFQQFCYEMETDCGVKATASMMMYDDQLTKHESEKQTRMWGFYGLLVSFVPVIGILAHHGWGPENYRLWIVIVSMIVAFIATAVSNDFYFKAIRRDLGEYRAISASFRLLAQEAQKGYKVDAVTIATQNDLLSKITSLNNNRRDLEKVFTPTLNFLKKAQEENIVSQDERTIPSLRLI
jgi:hypothetical protein